MAFQPLWEAEKDSRNVEITYLKPNSLAMALKMPL